MYDKTSSIMDRFDELFNDNFITTATNEEIEARFEYLKSLCVRDKIDFAALLDELEFYCNSYIAEMIGNKVSPPPVSEPVSGIEEAATSSANRCRNAETD
ncbi:MAG: hypothetical protein PHQ27_03405 [Victivallales bacterium]|nr:hypothetical protein [Victivallales bacterium]